MNIEKALDRVSRKMTELGDEKKRFTKSSCKGSDEPLPRSKKKVKVGSELSEECWVQVGANQGSV